VRSEDEIVEEKERLTLLLHTEESKIRNNPRHYADDEYDLQTAVIKAAGFRGQLRELEWLRGK